MKSFVAVGVSFLAVMFIACGGFGSKKEAVVEKGNQPVKSKDSAKTERWAISGQESASLGGFKMFVKSVRVDFVSVSSFGDNISKNKCLIVNLSLLNTLSNKKLEYKGWAGDLFGTPVKLTDDIGNSYRMITFGFASNIKGQVSGNESIYPGKSCEDILVFEPPVNDFQSLYLTLPGSNLGEDAGVVRFVIPADMVKR